MAGKTKLGRRVQGLRLGRGWSKEKLAEEAGVSATTILNIETSTTATPRDETLIGMAKAFGLTPRQLLNGHIPEQGKPEPQPTPQRVVRRIQSAVSGITPEVEYVTKKMQQLSPKDQIEVLTLIASL
jgi:transcriptional regulator with XRE-family HTH domain